MYLELNPVLWTTNTFAFETADRFTTFLEARNAVQRKLLRSVSLTVTSVIHRAWHAYVRPKHVKMLPNLCSLRVFVDVGLLTYLDRWYFQKPDWSWLRSFKALPLDDLEVCVRGYRGDDIAVSGKCLAWADELTAELLEGNGPAWLEANKKATKEKRQKDKADQAAILAERFCRQGSQAACIRWYQKLLDNTWDRANKPRKLVLKACGRKHRSCRPVCEGECDHVENADGIESLRHHQGFKHS